MSERVFTIFEGPDAGRAFVLGDETIEIGREAGRDVVLHDDRASRGHSRIIPDGDQVVLVDLNSSNGTFVNGKLVGECELREGDVIAIGNTKIVFGSEPPPSRTEAERGAAAGRDRRRDRLPGVTTEILPPSAPVVPIRPTEAHLAELLRAAAKAALAAAELRNVPIAVEVELEPDVVSVDTAQLHKALTGLLSGLLAMQPQAVAGDDAQAASALALRAGQDVERGGFKVEIIRIGSPISRTQIAAREGDGLFLEAHHMALAHGGLLELVPSDSPDTLARLRLPFGASGATRETIVQ